MGETSEGKVDPPEHARSGDASGTLRGTGSDDAQVLVIEAAVLAQSSAGDAVVARVDRFRTVAEPSIGAKRTKWYHGPLRGSSSGLVSRSVGGIPVQNFNAATAVLDQVYGIYISLGPRGRDWAEAHPPLKMFAFTLSL